MTRRTGTRSARLPRACSLAGRGNAQRRRYAQVSRGQGKLITIIGDITVVNHRFVVRTRVHLLSALAVGMLLSSRPSLGQTAGAVPLPEQAPNSVPPPKGTSGRLHAAPPVAPSPGHPADGRGLNARRGDSQRDHRGARKKPPGGQSVADHHAGMRPSQLFQERFDLQVMSWRDGSRVPTSGNKLVIVGFDNHDLLHIRIFDAGGKRVMDTDETKLPDAQVGAILTLKRRLQGLSAPHVLTGGEKARVIMKVTSIVAQTGQAPQRQSRQAQPRD
jgi:hypothetical protein